MKKLFGLLAIMFAFILSVSAQSTTPRFGITPSGDNTGRVLNYKIATLTDAAGADSLTVSTNAYETIYKVALTDSLVLEQPAITQAYYGDVLIMVFTSTTGTPKVDFYGTYWKSSGTATLSTGLRGVVTFIFDGAYWVESSRSIH